MGGPALPSHWPAEVAEHYEPVRSLGQGGFASVLLAKKKKGDNMDSLAALKVVGSSSEQNTNGYAHREIDILKELSHPNIMKVLDYWETTSIVVMALSYSPGPTLDHLLRHGGALGFTFGRVVMAQLVDALAYCHSRATIHRDIKPDNVIVTGASPTTQEEIWIDPEGTTTTDKSLEEWKLLCQKWHVTLIDFGFARALSPDDVEMEKFAIQQLSASETASVSQHSSRSRHMTSSRRTYKKSISHEFKRQMSAVGNKNYAAPEIVQGVHSHHSAVVIGASGGSGTPSTGVDITKTLSHHVANYGMLADSFSLGNTLQYMMTGVPPHLNVTDVVNNHNSPVGKFLRWIAEHACASKDATTTSRKYQYRAWGGMPKEMMRLIRGLNHPSVSQRISIRATRRYPLIESVLDDTSATGEPEEAVHCEIHFLPCTMKKLKRREAQLLAHQEELPSAPLAVEESN